MYTILVAVEPLVILDTLVDVIVKVSVLVAPTCALFNSKVLLKFQVTVYVVASPGPSDGSVGVGVGVGSSPPPPSLQSAKPLHSVPRVIVPCKSIETEFSSAHTVVHVLGSKLPL